MKKNRILTESGAYFPRCVALPARETLLLEEEMMLYMGQSGGTSGGSSGSGSGRQTVQIPAPVIAADATKTISSQMPSEIKKIEDAAAFGVIPSGNTDSTRTSGRQLAEDVRNAVVDTSGSAPPTPDPSQDDSENWELSDILTIQFWERLAGL